MGARVSSGRQTWLRWFGPIKKWIVTPRTDGIIMLNIKGPVPKCAH
jgi:hypothetical protein